jgi:hypothetical protein
MTVEVDLSGMHIEDAALRLVKAARIHQQIASGVFNGISLSARTTTSPDFIVSAYRGKVKMRKRAREIQMQRAADQQAEQAQPNHGLSCLSAAPEPDVGMRSGTARWVK